MCRTQRAAKEHANVALTPAKEAIKKGLAEQGTPKAAQVARQLDAVHDGLHDSIQSGVTEPHVPVGFPTLTAAWCLIAVRACARNWLTRSTISAMCSMMPRKCSSPSAERHRRPLARQHRRAPPPPARSVALLRLRTCASLPRLRTGPVIRRVTPSRAMTRAVVGRRLSLTTTHTIVWEVHRRGTAVTRHLRAIAQVLYCKRHAWTWRELVCWRRSTPSGEGAGGCGCTQQIDSQRAARKVGM